MTQQKKADPAELQTCVRNHKLGEEASHPCTHDGDHLVSGDGFASGSSGAARVQFDAVMKEHGRFLVNFIRSLRIDKQDVADVTQEILCAVFCSLPRFDPYRGDMRSWLSGVAMHQVSLYRRHTYRHRHEDPVPSSDIFSYNSPSAEQKLIEEERKGLLYQLIEQVPPERRCILLKHDMDDIELSKIAESLSMPIGTAKTRYRRSLKDLNIARSHWQARQRRNGHESVPVVFVILLRAKHAWASHSRTLGAAFTGTLAATVAVVLGLSSLPQPGPPATTFALPIVPQTSASLATAPAAIPPPVSPPRAATTRTSAVRPETNPAESRLFDRAVALFKTGQYGLARDLFQEHATEYPDGAHAAERNAYLRRLRSQSVPSSP